MSLQDRYQSEKAKWDDLAKRQLARLRILGLDEDFHKYAASEVELTGVSEFLGDLHGKRILEIGCGGGLIAALLAKSGAQVTAFDLSPASVKVAKKRSTINNTGVDFLVSAGEYLPFADESFEIVFGKSILHHLDLETGKHDLYRILRKGGKAVFTDLDTWTQNIQYRKYREVQLMSMIERGFGWDKQFPFLRKLDEYLLKYFPILRRFCRYVVIFSIK